METAITEEQQFTNLCNEVLDHCMRTENVTDDDIFDGVSRLIKAFRYDLGHSFSDVDLNDSNNACAYLYRYGPLGAGLVRDRLLEAIRNCSILCDLLRKQDLRVLSLGGGPGNDIIGFCSAAFPYLQQCPCHSHGNMQQCVCDPAMQQSLCQRRTLRLTVVDSFQKWAAIMNVLNSFLLHGNYGLTSQLFKQYGVYMSFCCVTLPGNLNDHADYFENLQNADIIILAKLLSIVPSYDMRADIVSQIAQAMKPEALLLYIDTSFYEDFPQFDVIWRSSSEHYVFPIQIERFYKENARISKANIVVLKKKMLKGNEL